MSENIAVIGGGMAGTAAAHTLVKRGYNVTIIERNERLGGRVRSELVNGAAVEMGAGFMTGDYQNVLNFMRTNRLSNFLYAQQGSSGIWRDGEVRMVTPGALIGNKLLSWRAKSHAISLLMKTLTGWRNLDSHAFWKANVYDDRSVSAMFMHGKEFMEYALQPALNGYFYWTPEHTSEAMVRILCKAAFTHNTYRVQGGLKQIPEVAAKGCTLLLGHTTKTVERSNNGGYNITVEKDGKTHTLSFDAIVCATTATKVSGLFPDMAKKQKEFFDAVKYSSTALSASTYLESQTRGDKAIAFPRREGSDLSAVTLSPKPDAKGDLLATVNIYVSGIAASRYCKLPDDELIEKLTEASAPVRDALFVGEPVPIKIHTQRWDEALPFFDTGHFKRLQEFEEGKIEDPSHTIVFAGDYLGGPFMEGAFTSGMQAAERLVSRLSKQ